MRGTIPHNHSSLKTSLFSILRPKWATFSKCVCLIKAYNTHLTAFTENKQEVRNFPNLHTHFIH